MVVVRGKDPKFSFEMLAAGILWGEEKVQYTVRDTCTNSPPLWIGQNN
jgi:hypothetical protein